MPFCASHKSGKGGLNRSEATEGVLPDTYCAIPFASETDHKMQSLLQTEAKNLDFDYCHAQLSG